VLLKSYIALASQWPVSWNYRILGVKCTRLQQLSDGGAYKDIYSFTE